jgi:hypothetical protein
METRKRCSRCKEEKSHEFFYKDSRSKDGLQHRCKTCHAILAKRWWEQNGKESYRQQKENQLKWKKRNPERYAARQRRYHLRRKYGFDQVEFQQRLLDQGGKCACCGDGGIELVVDHCHKLGTVRSLLCQPCNKGLGAFSDSPDRLRAAIAYLEKHNGG